MKKQMIVSCDGIVSCRHQSSIVEHLERSEWLAAATTSIVSCVAF